MQIIQIFIYSSANQNCKIKILYKNIEVDLVELIRLNLSRKIGSSKRITQVKTVWDQIEFYYNKLSNRWKMARAVRYIDHENETHNSLE